MEIKKTGKNGQKFLCKKCDFNCSQLSDWKRHIMRAKHLTGNNGNRKNGALEKILCVCGRNFVTKSGLWKHTKHCETGQSILIESSTKELQEFKMSETVLLNLLQQNQDFKDLIVEQNKQIIEQNKQLFELANKDKNIIVNANHTTNNNKFNMNFFLNEQCKDALNIMDFVDSLKMQLTDLDLIGDIGFTEGISKIFIRGLKELDIFKRPIHCSDLKRDILYVRDKDTWEKENDEKNRIKLAIQYITNNNIKQLPEWIKKYPAATQDYDSKKHEEYMKILIETMGSTDDKQNERNVQRIIKNISREVVIDKMICI